MGLKHGVDIPQGRVLKKNWSRSLNLEIRGESWVPEARTKRHRHKGEETERGISPLFGRWGSTKFWNSRLQEMHSEAILSIFCHWILLELLKGIFFVKYTTMLYQWQLVTNKVIQSNFPGNFHNKISLRISLLQEELN